MPWDSTGLYIADFDNGRIVESSITKISGDHPIAVLSYQFALNGDLLFVMDRAGCKENDPGNWSNIYRYHNNQVGAVTAVQAEFGFPQWQLGMSNFEPGPSGSIAAACFRDGYNKLLVIEPDTNAISEVETDLDAYGSLSFIDSHTVALIGRDHPRLKQRRLSGNQTHQQCRNEPWRYITGTARQLSHH